MLPTCQRTQKQLFHCTFNSLKAFTWTAAALLPPEGFIMKPNRRPDMQGACSSAGICPPDRDSTLLKGFKCLSTDYQFVKVIIPRTTRASTTNLIAEDKPAKGGKQ